ncbi:hypothetical protein ACFFX1_43940 [Dactylosporangium sucinum]|uniref:Uncharacterized protein n=1 Tax=Dactylosporangium sucinum TaxID=1424081 RepID=A0A917X6B2_9ACTN|nr:hypothetical protein [Dactylosporangium sucinum]GGM73238.1 hypothetical protein GCM10007977_088570 [Dactylosporangium sucinum]
MRVMAGPPGFVELAEHPDESGRFGSAVVPAAALPALVAVVEAACAAPARPPPVRARYASLAALVEHLAPSPGGHGDLEDRLARAFRARVASGELADGQARGAARDRVTAWFTAAGVDHEPADWFWVNSD